MLAVNAEVQRRIDARDARLKQEEGKAQQSQEPMRLATPPLVEPPLSFNTHDSMPPVILSPFESVQAPSSTFQSPDQQQAPVSSAGFNSAAGPAGAVWGQHYGDHQDPGSFNSRNVRTVAVGESPSGRNMHTSDQESAASAHSEVTQPASHTPVGMTDAELVKLAGLKAGQQQAQQAQQPAVSQPVSNAAPVPISILTTADSRKAAGPEEGKQRRKSKREKAKGLLSSFTMRCALHMSL